jgi:hypothetical protein
VPSGGYQAAYLSAHPEADLSPRPGAYQQAPQPQQAYPAALPSDIPTQYPPAQQSVARPETEPIDYPSVMDGYPQPGQSPTNDPGPMAASLHANRSAPQAPPSEQPVPGQLGSYPPPGAPAPESSATEFTASLLSQAPPPSIAALLGNQPAQPALSAAPAPAPGNQPAQPALSAAPAPANSDLGRRAAAQLAAAEQLAQQNGVADKAAAYQAAAEKAIADKAAFESAAAKTAADKAVVAEQVDQAAARLITPSTSSIPAVSQQILPEPAASGGFTEGYQAGFRAALEGKAQVAASEKRSREVDPNAEPVPLAGLDPANQARSRGQALNPNNDPLTAPAHRGA